MLARTLAALLLLAACSKEPLTRVEPTGGSPGSAAVPAAGSGAPTEPGPGPAVTGGSAGSATGPAHPGHTPTPAAEGAKLGEPCGAGDACGEGSCVTYYGFAGPRGPQFKSCEIRCDPQGRCEGGRRCITVADGPGQVCR